MGEEGGESRLLGLGLGSVQNEGSPPPSLPCPGSGCIWEVQEGHPLPYLPPPANSSPGHSLAPQKGCALKLKNYSLCFGNSHMLDILCFIRRPLPRAPPPAIGCPGVGTSQARWADTPRVPVQGCGSGWAHLGPADFSGDRSSRSGSPKVQQSSLPGPWWHAMSPSHFLK